MDELRFDEQVAIITGAGGGLGEHYAQLLAARGAQVLVNDLGGTVDGTTDSSDAAVPESRSQTVARAITDLGGVAVADHNSVATRSGGQAIVDHAIAEFGRVDIVINNAGIIKNRTLQNIGEAELEAVLDVHVLGAFHVTKPAYLLMRQAGYGRIVHTSSASGLFGFFGQTAYATAKMGLVGFTKTLALEGARHGVVVNAIAPGALTRMTGDVMGAGSALADQTGMDADELGEHMGPHQVAPVVAYLAHESCALTGEVLSAMGGRVARTFVAQTRGIYSDALTPELIASSVDQICDEADYVVPSSIDAETALLLSHLRQT